MKKILIVIFLFFITSISFSQWTSISPLPFGVSMNSMQFIDNNTGWVLCSDGIILKTTNSGEDWNNLNTGITSYLRSASFINSQQGWVVGNENTVLKTIDGGNNWIMLNTGQPENFAIGYVKFFNENVGYIVGGYNAGNRGMNFTTTDNGENWITNTQGDRTWFDTVYYNEKNELIAEIFDYTTNKKLELKSLDNGSSWVTEDNGKGKWLRDITYETDKNADALSVNFRDFTSFCIKTTDGGNTWTQKNIYSTNLVNFTDETTGYDFTNNKLYKTTDSGENWNIIYEDCCSNPDAVFFLDNNHGWMGGEEPYFPFRKTTDGGLTWNFSSKDGDVKDIFFLNENEGWVVATSHHYPNYSIYEKTLDGGETFENYFAPEFITINSLYFTASGSGWAIGENSTLMKTNISGDFKIFPFFGSNTNIKSIQFIDDQNGWCADSDEDDNWGSFGNMWKTSDGGKNWELLKTFQWGALVNDIYFFNENIGWLAGWEGSIAYTSNGGNSWTWQQSNSDEVFYDIHFINEQTGWAVGAGGLILYTNDSGNNWIPQSTGSTERFNSVYFINDQIGWLAGNSGSIYKTTNSGINWFPNTNVSYQLKSIFSIDENNVYAVGSDGLILKSTNGGSDWQIKTSNNTNTLNRIIFSDSNNGWVVGNSGTILYTNNGGNNWSNQNSGTIENLFSISFVNGNLGWAAGEHSTLLKFENESTTPVELISFTSVNENNRITLKWSTASEINNLGFFVERKTNNDWEILDFVSGYGTTSENHSYNYSDININQRSGKILYRLKQQDFNGSFEYSNIIEVDFNSVPNEFSLSQNYPNPFNPTTKIKYTISSNVKSEMSKVNLKVYDVLGNEVVTLVNEEKQSGIYEVEFNATEFASGIYYYRLEADNFVEVKKMILMK